LGESYVQGDIPATAAFAITEITHAAVRTGETSSILPVIVLAAGVITLALYMRKRREE